MIFFIFSYFQCPYDHCPSNTKRRRLTKLSLYHSQKNKRKTVHYSVGCKNCSCLCKGLKPKVMTIESNTTVELVSNANEKPLNNNESCNGNFIPSLTLLDFEWKFKKPKPQPAATYSAHENLPELGKVHIIHNIINRNDTTCQELNCHQITMLWILCIRLTMWILN